MPTHAVTVPLYLEQDRPFIDITLTGPDGRTRTVRSWLDTGGGAMMVAETVARDLGLTWSDPLPENPAYAPVTIPGACVGDYPLDLTGARVVVQLGGPIAAGVRAEAFISGQVLARNHVIFDYPDRTFTIALPGALAPRGLAVPTPFAPGQCFPRMEVQIDGEPHGLLLDTGATCSMLSVTLLRTLMEKHPDWPRTTGAAGVANMIGAPDVNVPLMRVASIAAGDLCFGDLLVAGRGPGVFESYMSSMMTAPIVGALAGNALKQFRVEIDYANQTTYFEHLAGPDPGEMDLVGVILQAHPDGSFTLCGTARACGYTEGTVQPGDRLLAVDDHAVEGLSRPEVLALLRGVPGELRRLSVERGGVRVAVALPVVRML
ncbi:MAG: hypothetical protein K0R39_3425 [Symbiobacteriaceae bacterium]|jgi:hypothetical protein|nr:hypothetical protein [Symbiobacteriaceae bacterium]